MEASVIESSGGSGPHKTNGSSTDLSVGSPAQTGAKNRDNSSSSPTARGDGPLCLQDFVPTGSSLYGGQSIHPHIGSGGLLTATQQHHQDLLHHLHQVFNVKTCFTHHNV